MVSQDRTAEFFSLCQSLPPPATPQNTQPKPPPPPPSSRYSYKAEAAEELRTFHKTASIISKEIHSTSQLLSELTSLIHSRSGSLFVDESQKVNNLVLRIKSNIESLNTKLDASNEMIQRNKIRLGRNSQAGQEATNLVGQLQEEFVNTTKGFKNVLQVRSDRMKEKTDRETNFHKTSKEEEGETISLLGNKPKVYQESQDTGKLSSGLSSFGGGGFSNGGGLNLTEAASSGPRLDLTSAILQNQGGSSMNPGESTTQLPRPCTYFCFYLVYLTFLFSHLKLSCFSRWNSTNGK